MDRYSFLVSSAVTYVGTALSVAFLSLFYIVSLRIGTESFGALQSMLALMFLINASRGVAGGYVVLHVTGSDSTLGTVVPRAFAAALSIGTAIAATFVLASPLLQNFLRIDSPLPFVLIGLSAIPSLLSGTIDGILNVQRRFIALATSIALIPAATLVLGIVFFRDGFQQSDAGWIVLGSQCIGCLNALMADWSFQSSRKKRSDPTRLLRDIAVLLAASILFGAALRMDVFWARHVLSHSEAGSYAVASSIALVLYLLSNGIVRIASVSMRSGGKNVIALSYALILGMSVILAVGFALLGPPLLSWVIGRQFTPNWSVLAPLFAALTSYAIITFDFTCLNIVTKHVHVGIGIALVFTQAFALSMFGTSATAIALTECVVMTGLMTIFTAWLWKSLPLGTKHPPRNPAEHHLVQNG